MVFKQPQSNWPAEDLQHLGRCPICGATERSILFDGLKDWSYGAAAGCWSMWRCGGCSGAYLDPRPSEASIGRAYERYYTHEISKPHVIDQLIAGRGMKTRLRAGYYNFRFGHQLPDAFPLLATVAAAILPRQARIWEHFIRHLPPPTKPGAMLLDVGCGAGNFLILGRALGFTPIGIEADPKAANTARSAGIDVRSGSFPDSGLPAGQFEHITLSHVFEHLHHPEAAARELFRLLSPLGRLWFTQPNLDAAGLNLFGKHWRGLEAPRHLSLFGVESFVRFLEGAGFTDVKLLPPQPCAMDSFKASLSIRHGELPLPNIDPPNWGTRWRWKARRADRIADRSPKLGENLTVTAAKPALA